MTAKGTKTIGINAKNELIDEIERRAKSMHLSTGAYVKIILKKHLEPGKRIKLEER